MSKKKLDPCIWLSCSSVSIDKEDLDHPDERDEAASSLCQFGEPNTSSHSVRVASQP